MIDPDKVSTVKSDCISTPDVLRVEFGDVDVLNDDVLGSVGDAQALATDNT